MSQRDADPAAISIEEIAATRYAYPTEDRPTWQTIIAGQEPADAPSIAPADLAVFDSETNELVLAAVVETSADFSEYEAMLRWLPASRLAPTFLYVPAGATSQASDLSHELGIRLAGLRGWRHEAGELALEQARLRPFAMPQLVALLPAALRPDRFRTRPAAVSIPKLEVPPGHLFDLSIAVGIWAAVTLVSEVLLVFVVDKVMFPARGAEEAHTVDEAFRVLGYMAAPVFAFVVAILVYSSLRFRVSGSPDKDGPAFMGRGIAPWAWLVVTTGMTIMVIIFPGLTGLAELRGNNTADLVINVEAFQFGWDIEYEDSGIKLLSGRPDDALRLPLDRRVHFQITSKVPGPDAPEGAEADVLHSFWIPAFRMKIDAVPGRITHMFVTPDRLGRTADESVYRVQCAELCGAGHSVMSMALEVIEAEDFDAWVAERSAGGGPADAAGPALTTLGVELNEFNVIPELGTVEAGRSDFQVTNTGGGQHEFVVIKTDIPASDLPVDGGVVDETGLEKFGRTALLAPGQQEVLAADLRAGAYALICNVPGHYQLGMFASFSVTESTRAAEPAAEATTLATDLSEWAVEAEVDAITAGLIEFQATNVGSTIHELVVIRSDAGADDLLLTGALVDESQVEVMGRVEILDSGGTGSVTLNLRAGRYLLICNVPGHYVLGMRTVLTVSE